ncbi:MAG: hypothetical protein ABI574_04730 [Burkholderiales bacterium]
MRHAFFILMAIAGMYVGWRTLPADDKKVLRRVARAYGLQAASLLIVLWVVVLAAYESSHATIIS